MAEKNLDPTDHKLEESHKKGQVAVSRDLAHCLLLFVGVEAAFGLEKMARSGIGQLFDLAMRAPAHNFKEILSGMLVAVGMILAVAFCTFGLIAIVCGVVGFWGQFGVLFAPDPLIPSPDKISPLSTLKQIFSVKKLNEILLGIFKMIMFGILTYLTTKWELPNLVGLAGGNTEQIYGAAMALFRHLFHLLLLVSLILAVLDFFVQKAAHIKQLKMSIDEVIREHKENEGDPMIKGQRRNLALEILNADPVEQTGEANAVVVNPTHFAVAMLFDPAQGIKVPMVCAKGSGPTALAMIARATEKGIPVIRHVWLARTLFATAKSRKAIPRSLFDPVALVYTVVDHLKDVQGQGCVILDESGLPPDMPGEPETPESPESL
jgi:type III secretion protein U